jgi:thiamine monophosphate synthase
MGFKLMAVATAEELPVGKTWLSDLLLSGLETLHLRTKSYSESEFKQFIQLIPTSYFPCITIHAHYGLAGRLGLGGIHLTETKKNAG